MNTPTTSLPFESIASEALTHVPALSPEFYAKLHDEAVRQTQRRSRRRRTLLRMRIASGIAATLAIATGIGLYTASSRASAPLQEQMARTVMTLTEGYDFNPQGDFPEQFLAFQEAPGMF